MKDSSTLRDLAFFHSLGHIFGKTDQTYMTVLSQIEKVTVKLWMSAGIALAEFSTFQNPDAVVLLINSYSVNIIGVESESEFWPGVESQSPF